MQQLRLANSKDLSKIMAIIADAKAILKKSGSTQWQNGYPNEAVIKQDIANQNGYVFVVDDNVAGYAAVIEGIEPTYQEINGSWKNDTDEYATIHRICFSKNYLGQGLGKDFLAEIISTEKSHGIKNLRVDTHPLNMSMQSLAVHHGFEYRGIIKCNEKIDPDRLAYELNL